MAIVTFELNGRPRRVRKRIDELPDYLAQIKAMPQRLNVQVEHDTDDAAALVPALVDLIETLRGKGAIQDADLPAETRATLVRLRAARRDLRAEVRS